MDAAIRDVTAGGDLDQARVLLAEYLALQVDNYPDPPAVARAHRDEIANLPGRYTPPEGGFLLALIGDQPAGCVALCRQSPGIGEMKRLFVREQLRGRGLGRILAEAVIEAARHAGYSRLRLDVHTSRRPAIALYQSLGFVTTKPWEETWFDVLFMELRL